MIWVDSVACVLMGAGLLGRQRPPWPYLRCRIDSGGLWPAVPGCRLRLGGTRVHRQPTRRSLRPRSRIAFARVHECGQMQLVRDPRDIHIGLNP
jgi:hypothetical protein